MDLIAEAHKRDVRCLVYTGFVDADSLAAARCCGGGRHRLQGGTSAGARLGVAVRGRRSEAPTSSKLFEPRHQGPELAFAYSPGIRGRRTLSLKG